MCAVRLFCSHIGCGSNEIQQAMDNRLSLVKLLLNYGADVNVRLGYINIYEHPLLFAIYNFEQINSEDEDLNVEPRELLEKISNWFIELIKLLVDHGSILELPESERDGERNERATFLKPMRKVREALIYLFKAGAPLELLVFTCNYCCVWNFNSFDAVNQIRNSNLVDALELNGFTFDTADSRGWSRRRRRRRRNKKQCKVFSLLQESRVAIRRQLYISANKRSILPSIDQLPLSHDLKLYLKFEGVYNEVDFL